MPSDILCFGFCDNDDVPDLNLLLKHCYEFYTFAFLFFRFYTLMVLSTALFGKPAFRNLICNGLVLAEDGKKMSKSLKNYPSPMDVINDYGAVEAFHNTLFFIFI